MNALKRGVRLFFSGVELDSERLGLSAGTVDAHGVGLGAWYFPEAVLPAEPWRGPTQEELELLLADAGHPWEASSCIAVTRVPELLLRMLDGLGIDGVTRISDCRVLYDSPALAQRLEQFNASLVRHYAHRSGRIHPLGLTFHPPGLPTVTSQAVASDPSRKRLRLGLHVDDAVEAPIPERTQSPNRLAINVGRVNRYLLVINQPLQALRDALGPGAPERRSSPEAVARDFMQAFPGYPVLRIQLRPGEAYIAPTDNLVHDGSTACADLPSASVHIIGDFGLA